MKSERVQENREELMKVLRRINPTGDTKAEADRFEAQSRKHIILVLAAAIIIAVLSAVLPGGSVLEAGGVLMRNAAGGGAYIVSLIASIGDDEIETSVSVAEQALSGDEVTELFEAAEAELTARMLGENESADEIIYDLDLPSETEDGLVEAQWAFDSYEVLDYDGTIRADVPEDGSVVGVTLTMTYLDQTAESVFSICVRPKTLSEEELLAAALEEALEDADEESAADEAFVLPDEVEGLSVAWREADEYLWLKILFLGLAAAIIVHYEERERLKRASAKRDEQMMKDYAAIVNKLSLLLGAGMTVYGAWEKIAMNYMQKQRMAAESETRRGRNGKRNVTEKRAAYEEMCVTYAQIRGGAGEAGAYEEFGRRCGLRPYLKLGAILARNLKLGTEGVTHQLTAEADEAFEQRKALAKQKGEEAGTKLLAPMMMLMGVVMAITAVPGFLSF